VTANDVSQNAIGATWGAQVAQRALLGLIVFVVLVVLFIWAYFREWKMSVAAIVALAHDIVITVGVYALSGFEVTPATVTGLLTILGFSLYDTVVVFDKVRENTKNLARTRMTYGEAGAYSSIFIATPLAVQLKELEPGVKAGDARVVRARKKHENADRYAAVPVFTEDMPVQDEPGAAPADVDEPVRTPAAPRAVREARYTAGERPAGREVRPSPSSKRAQPERKPRSQRGKK
jgi:preprotein translocase subunit SecF